MQNKRRTRQYGEIKDPAKVTYSGLALTSRGLGFKGANANSQAGKHSGGRKAAQCYACAAAAACERVSPCDDAVEQQLEDDGGLRTIGARTRVVRSRDRRARGRKTDHTCPYDDDEYETVGCCDAVHAITTTEAEHLTRQLVAVDG